MSGKKMTIKTDDAPAAIGPYAQAVVHNGLVFVSGQLPINPATGKLIQAGPAEQTHQVMANLKAILEQSGSNLEQVLKATIFVQNLDHFDEINAAYGEYFTNPPARACVEVSRLPKGAGVEIEVVAAVAE